MRRIQLPSKKVCAAIVLVAGLCIGVPSFVLSTSPASTYSHHLYLAAKEFGCAYRRIPNPEEIADAFTQWSKEDSNRAHRYLSSSYLTIQVVPQSVDDRKLEFDLVFLWKKWWPNRYTEKARIVFAECDSERSAEWRREIDQARARSLGG